MSSSRPPVLIGRWMTAMALVLGISSIVYGVQYAAGPKGWHQTSGQEIIKALPVPLVIYGVLFIVGGVATLIPRLRPPGLALSGIVFGFFGGTLWEQEAFGPKGWFEVGLWRGSPPSLAVGTTVISTFYFFACRRALLGDPDKNFEEAVAYAVQQALAERVAGA